MKKETNSLYSIYSIEKENKDVKKVTPAPCGCTIDYPHSHLVAGHECDCEKGLNKQQ